MDQDEAWAAGCRAWVLKASRAVDCRTALVLNPECEVIAQASILGIRKEKVGDDRFEILGDLEVDGDYIGKVTPRGHSQNPFAYLAADAF